MFNNYKRIKELEEKILDLEEKIPNEYDIRIVAGEKMKEEEAELSKIYEAREDAREEALNAIRNNIEDIVEQRLPVLIKEATKDIQDELIVELARKAMNMEEKK